MLLHKPVLKQGNTTTARYEQKKVCNKKSFEEIQNGDVEYWLQLIGNRRIRSIRKF